MSTARDLLKHAGKGWASDDMVPESKGGRMRDGERFGWLLCLAGLGMAILLLTEMWRMGK